MIYSKFAELLFFILFYSLFSNKIVNSKETTASDEVSSCQKADGPIQSCQECVNIAQVIAILFKKIFAEIILLIV